MINAIIEKYGLMEGLTVSGDKIIDWPYAVTKPTKAKLKIIIDEYNAIERAPRKTLLEMYEDLEARVKALEAL